MSDSFRAHPGDEVNLVVEVDNGDGQAVTFSIATADGAPLDSLTATIRSGVARAFWTVDAKGHDLPLDVTFSASAGGQLVDSGTLTIDPPGSISTPAWLLLSTGSSAAAGQGELSDLEGDEDLVSRQAPDARVPYRSFLPGDQIGLCVDVSGPDGEPLVGDFDVTFDLQKANDLCASDYRSVKKFVRKLSAPNGISQVGARWTMSTMGLPPPYRFRFVVSWARRPGEQQTPDSQQSALASEPS